jgi:hypothetical protein
MRNTKTCGEVLQLRDEKEDLKFLITMSRTLHVISSEAPPCRSVFPLQRCILDPEETFRVRLMGRPRKIRLAACIRLTCEDLDWAWHIRSSAAATAENIIEQGRFTSLQLALDHDSLFFRQRARDPGRFYRNGTTLHPRSPNTSLVYRTAYYLFDVRINMRPQMVPPISKYIYIRFKDYKRLNSTKICVPLLARHRIWTRPSKRRAHMEDWEWRESEFVERQLDP